VAKKTSKKQGIIHPLCRFSRRWTIFDTSIENVNLWEFDQAEYLKKDGMIPGFID
jgi:hypothetical protein